MRSLEGRMQQAQVNWFRYQYPKLGKLLFAIPNGGKREKKLVKTKTGYKRISLEGKNLKDQGVTAGVSDLILLVPRKGYGALCIENKTEDGEQSNSQEEWQVLAEENGNKYVVIRNIEEFMNVVNDYLS
jgi:hypothetical protein